ncbi:MAG: hypothetical protein WA030_01920 [Candidatus Microsaccharimonas sp.]
MQPENTRPQVGPEQLPMPPTRVGEQLSVAPSPESGIETRGEQFEQTAEAAAAATDMAAQSAPIQQVAVPVITPVVPVADSTNPAVAADEDVIEKEWVDKAKQIILATKDDPHGRSSKVSELQKDYLQKRYGKVIGAGE